jgi:hypothetical protein
LTSKINPLGIIWLNILNHPLKELERVARAEKKYLPPLNSKVEYRIENELRRLWNYPQNSNRPVFNGEKKKNHRAQHVVHKMQAGRLG